MSWLDLFQAWELVELDLQEIGVDLGDEQLMTSRSWTWLSRRILGLLSRPVGRDMSGMPVFVNRVQQQFIQPIIDRRDAAANG